MKQKFIFSIILLVLCGALLYSNLQNKNTARQISPQNPKIKVAATIFPLYDIVRQVAGDKIDVELILPSGSNPHSFEMNPRQVQSLQTTRAVFMVGHGADNWVGEQLLNDARVMTVTVDQECFLQPFNDSIVTDVTNTAERHYHHHHEQNIDPHYWLSVANAKQIALNVSQHLSQLDAENSSYYQNRAQNFNDKLDQRMIGWQQTLSGVQNKKIVTFHNAWGYFTKQFDWEVAMSIEPFAGKVPSPQYLVDLNRVIQESKIKTVFIEPQFSQDVVKSLAEDLHLQVKVLDPLGGTAELQSYEDLIDFNVRMLAS